MEKSRWRIQDGEPNDVIANKNGITLYIKLKAI